MDILDAVAVSIRCGACSGEYQVPLKQVLLSHQMLHDGCPVSDERECPPLHWSRLVDEQLVREFQNVWSRVEERARNAGGELILLSEGEHGIKAGSITHSA
jgi:hypothetical protein